MNIRRSRSLWAVVAVVVVLIAILGGVAWLPMLVPDHRPQRDEAASGVAGFGDAPAADSTSTTPAATASPSETGPTAGATSGGGSAGGGGSTGGGGGSTGGGGGSTTPPVQDPTPVNIALFNANGFGSLYQGWLPVLGVCSTYAPSTPYEISSGLLVSIWCPWRGTAPAPVITFRRFGTATQAKDYMICQQPAGTPPPDVNESKVDLPGSNGSREGFYCEYAALNTPNDGIGDIGLCWTDATLPLDAEIYLGQTSMAAGAATLTRLRTLWSTYA